MSSFTYSHNFGTKEMSKYGKQGGERKRERLHGSEKGKLDGSQTRTMFPYIAD
jgi:hypothetical protein